MVLLGCTPRERNTEQHDIFFGIAGSLSELKTQMIEFWKEAKLHIDAWREVQHVDGYKLEVVKKEQSDPAQKEKLFFVNLGGYKRNEFDEFHYKLLLVCEDKGKAIQRAKQTAFYQHTGFEGATSHVDDKFGVDVDDVYEIEDILSRELKEKYGLRITQSNEVAEEDEFHLGYLKMEKL
jgi:hypothetical protein